jgi:MFS family permease
MKPSLILMLSNVAVFASLLFIPNLARELGSSEFEVGIIGAVYGLAVFTSSYIFGRAADVYDRKRIVRLGLLVSTVSVFLQALSDPSFVVPILSSPLLLAFTRGLAGFSLGMFPAALVAHVHESRRSLGRFSAFGALGLAVGTFVAGLISLYWGVFVFSSVCVFLAFVLSLTLSNVGKPALKVPFFPRELFKRNWGVYLPFFLRHTGANCIWIVYPLYIASLGGDKFWIGLIYTVNTATQFMVMQYIDRFDGKVLLNTGLILSFMTFIAISLAESVIQLIPAQILLGTSWSCLYVGSLVYLMNHNVEKSTSGGILGSLISLSMVLGSLLGGALWGLFGFRATMYTAACLTAAGFCVLRLSKGHKSKNTRSGGK